MPQDFNYWAKRPRIDKGDWLDNGDWVKGYWDSKDHPHRRLILDAIIDCAPIRSLVEVGCSAGPNLALIKERMGDAVPVLAGIDANADSISFAKDKLPEVDLRVGDLLELPWEKDQFDMVVADASLMYVEPDDIGIALREMD